VDSFYIPFVSCYVLPVSPGYDGGPRLIWNLSGAVKGLDGFLTVRKNIDVPTFVALLCILHYTNPYGWKNKNSWVLSGASRGLLAALLSLPQCHAAFSTMLHTLASVDHCPC